MSAFDLSAVTESTEAVIAGHRFLIHPGVTKAGRYWRLLTVDGVPAGIVAEHWVRAMGRIYQVYEASTPTTQRQAVSAMAAARFIARSLQAKR